MILYHAITTFHILEFIVHRHAYHKMDVAVLLLPEFIFEKGDLVDKLKEFGFFNEIRKFRYRKISGKNVEEILKKTEDAVNLAIPDLNEFEEINIAGSQYYFAVWCVCNNKHFNLFEEATGVITDPAALRRSVVAINPLQDEIADAYGMYTGDNEMIDKIYCNWDVQDKSLVTKEKKNKIVDFQIIKELKRLNAESQHSIFSFFDVPQKLKVPKDAYIMITQHFHNLNLMTFEQQAELYQLMVDYFIPDKTIVYKPHPEDLHNYELITSNANTINVKAPMELIVSAFEEIPFGVATIGSTAIRNISSAFESVLKFNDNFATCYQKVHIYYFFCKLISEINVSDYKKIYAVGANKPLLENMIHFVVKELNAVDVQYIDCIGEIKDLQNFDLVFIDELSDDDIRLKHFLENMKENNIVYFTNYNDDYNLFKICDYSFDSELLSNILPKRILINPFEDAEYIYASTGEHVIYVYTNNKIKYEEIQTMSFEKNLNNAKVTTRIPEDTDKDTTIALLKGMLEATEKRLHYYMKREKELMDKGEK